MFFIHFSAILPSVSNLLKLRPYFLYPLPLPGFCKCYCQCFQSRGFVIAILYALSDLVRSIPLPGLCQCYHQCFQGPVSMSLLCISNLLCLLPLADFCQGSS